MTTSRITVGAVALCMCAGAVLGTAPRWDMLALSNTQAPGLPQGLLLSPGGFGSPHVDAAGNIVFRALLSGDGVTTSNDAAVFAFPVGSAPVAVAREGDIAPGTGGARYLSISAPLLVNGRIAFTSTLTGTGVTTANNQAIFSGTPGAISMVARKGALVATTGATINTINDFAISQVGALAFRVGLLGGATTASNDTCILYSSGGVTTVAGREGTSLPAISATAKIGDLASGPLVAPVLGFAEAVAALTGAGSGSTNTLFRFTVAGPEIIARAKAAAPGQAAGVTFLDIPQITSANSTGTTVFQGTLTGPGVNSGTNVGIWQGWPGNVTMAIRLNIYAANTGLSFQALTSSPAINDGGVLAFGASLWGSGATATNSSGIFKLVGATHSLLARAGNLVPDLTDGTVYAVDAPSRVLINNSGKVFVRMRSITNEVSRDGLFVFRPNGTMSTLLREGDSLQLSPGDTRTISGLWLASTGNSSGADGRGSAIGGAETVVAQLAFVEGGNAIVQISGGCAADFNSDGEVDFFDYLDFVDAFSSNLHVADFNADGIVDFFDYLDFVDAFSSAC